jgi:hypothetical protein
VDVAVSALMRYGRCQLASGKRIVVNGCLMLIYGSLRVVVRGLYRVVIKCYLPRLGKFFNILRTFCSVSNQDYGL